MFLLFSLAHVLSVTCSRNFVCCVTVTPAVSGDEPLNHSCTTDLYLSSHKPFPENHCSVCHVINVLQVVSRGFQYQNFVCMSYFPHACYIPCNIRPFTNTKYNFRCVLDACLCSSRFSMAPPFPPPLAAGRVGWLLTDQSGLRSGWPASWLGPAGHFSRLVPVHRDEQETEVPASDWQHVG